MRAPLRTATQAFLLAVLMALAGAAFAQAAGKVVLAVGDVVAVRGADRVRLAAGAAVNSGDTVVTGAQSHAQIRFADNALVALKPDSEFRIEKFAYNGREDNANVAVFRLVRGGYRTLTGEIGRVNKEAYRVETTQATIGIRGTHYQLQICAASQCRNGADYAASGLYGGVFDGKVAVSNTLGAADYGADEYLLRAGRRGAAALAGAAGVPLGRPRHRRAVGGEGAARPSGRQGARDRLAAGPAARARAAVHLHGDRRPQPRRLGRGRGGSSSGPTATTLELDATGRPGVTLTTNADGAMTSFVNANLTANLGSASLVDTGRDGSTAGLNWGRWQGQGSTIRQSMPDGTGSEQRRRQPPLHLRQRAGGAADVGAGHVRSRRRHAPDRLRDGGRGHAQLRRHHQRRLQSGAGDAERPFRRLHQRDVHAGRHGQHHRRPVLDRAARARPRAAPAPAAVR